MAEIVTLLLQLQLLKHSAPGAVAAEPLARAVYKLSEQYDVDPELVVKIIIVESKGRAGAINKKSSDYGIMQVNKSTAWLYGFSNECLMNWRCGLEAGIIVLSDLQDSKKYRHCSYNTGLKWEKKITACRKYESLLALVK